MPKLNWSFRKINEVLSARKLGHYNMEDTRAEAEVAFKNMKKSDVCVTLFRAHGLFNVLNNAELEDNIKFWRSRNCKVRDYNVKELDLGKKKVWTFVVQPPGAEGLCPLGLSLGLMVSGYTYIVRDFKTAMRVVEDMAGSGGPDASEDSDDE